MKPSIEVIIGTYEGFLLGYKVDEDEAGKFVFAQSFADKSHTSSIRCIAVHDAWIATGSTDDRIFIYDMRTRRQSNVLLSHEGTVNALAFSPDSTHLLSAGDDGQVIATRLNTWATEATWRKAHSGYAVTNLCCHPSGKLVLTLGNDTILRTWNLIKGRVAYKTNIKSKSSLGAHFDCLTWSLTGDYFTLSGLRGVEIWSIKTADVIHKATTTAKPVCICWVEDKTCLVGLENGQIMWMSLKAKDEGKLTTAHDARVKAMAFKDGILVTASSSGTMILWQVNISKRTLTELVAVNTGCRPICIGISDAQQLGNESAQKIPADKEIQQNISKSVKRKAPARGVVTIEYENDEDEVAKLDNKTKIDDAEPDEENSEDNQYKSKINDDAGQSAPKVTKSKSGKRKLPENKSTVQKKKVAGKTMGTTTRARSTRNRAPKEKLKPSVGKERNSK